MGSIKGPLGGPGTNPAKETGKETDELQAGLHSAAAEAFHLSSLRGHMRVSEN